MSDKLNVMLGTDQVIWKLGDLYSDCADPQIKTDMERCERDAKQINLDYAGKVGKLTPQSLFTLINKLENMETLLGRLSTFAFLQFITQTNNPEAGAFLQKIKEFHSRIGKETVFFELEWSKVSTKKAIIIVDDENILPYKHYLENLRRYSNHYLSHVEETLLIEKAPVGRSSWTNLFEKVLGQIKFGDRQRSEEEVLADLYSTDRSIRAQAAREMTVGLKSQLHVLTHIFNTILADKMIDDRLRNYSSWVSSMNLYNELHDETVNTLINCVTARYDITQRYYSFKRKELGVAELYDYDRYAPITQTAPISENKENNISGITWEECRKTVLYSFEKFSPQMAKIASLFFEKKWIHAPIIDGKRGGAFAHPCTPDVHPYIMVNYTGNVRDVSTVAHELGHGVHQYLAAEKGYFNSSTPLVLAETASVFAELLVFHAQLDRMEDAVARKTYTCQKLESIFATVFRQVAMNRFEQAIHTARREKGEISPEDISAFWIGTQREMFKDSITLTDDYSIWWSYIPHFLSTPGYVYSYAFGELLVLALYKHYLEDKKAFVPKFIDLLNAGGSKTPYELIKPFGFSLNDPNFWNGGLQIIDDLLDSLDN